MCNTPEQFAEVNNSITRSVATNKAAKVMDLLTEIEKQTTLIDALLQYKHTEVFYEMHQLSIKFFELLRSVMDPIVGVPDDISSMIDDVIRDMGYTIEHTQED